MSIRCAGHIRGCKQGDLVSTGGSGEVSWKKWLLIWDPKGGWKWDNIGARTRAFQAQRTAGAKTLRWDRLGMFWKKWKLRWSDPVTKRRRDEQRGGWSWSCCIRTVFSLWVLPPVGFPSSLYSLLSPAHLLPLLCFLHNYFRIPHAQIFQIAVSSVGCQLPLFLLHILSKVIHLKTTLAETTLW